jgi:Flp pilus assembly protein TadG
MRLHSKIPGPEKGTVPFRAGASAVEFAVVAPVAFLFVLALVIGGMGIFRYQELASVAREASRWASVRGAQYQQDTGQPAATAQDVYNNVIAPNAIGMDTTKLSYSVTWNADNRPYHTTIVNNQLVPVSNTVTVTLTYQWVPEAFFGGYTLTSTSTLPMTE